MAFLPRRSKPSSAADERWQRSLAEQLQRSSGGSSKSVTFGLTPQELGRIRVVAMANCQAFSVPPVNEDLQAAWTHEDATKYFASGGWWMPASAKSTPPNHAQQGKAMSLMDVIRLCGSLEP